MRLQEISEGRVKDLAIAREYEKTYGDQPEPSAYEEPFNYYITINGQPWKSGGKIKPFANEKRALAAANGLYAKNPRLKIDVLPVKK